MKKRIISLLLAAAMLVTLMPAAFAAGTYSDTDGHWGEAAIDRWSSYGVIGGYDGNVFVPDGSMTRAEVARVFVNLLGLERRTDISKYKDVAPSAWYYDDIAKCVAAGILNGDGVAAMNPETPVTREELFTMFARALGVAPKATANKQFIDGNEVSSWAAGYVNALADMGVINGYGGVLSPGSDINRASVMTVLDNAIKTYVTTNGATVDAGDGIVLVVADNVTVTGKVENLVVADSGKTVTVNGGAVDSVTVVGPQDKVIFTGAAAADTVTIPATAEGASVVVNSAAAVGSVVSEADNVTISGAGKVETAAVSGDNTTVNTDGTDLTVAPGTTGVTENGKPVTGGTTVETEPVQNQGTTTPVTPPVYVPTYYTVTFVNGEENTTQSVVAGGTATKPTDPTTTEKCKEFSGWYVANATAPYDFTAAVTGNLTLTAMWADKHTYETKEIKAADSTDTTVATQEICSVCGEAGEIVLNENAVAQVGDDYYVDVAKAVEGANGALITLLKEASVDGASLDTAVDGKTTVIDLNQKKLTVTQPTSGSQTVTVTSAGDVVGNLTIKNGSLKLNNAANQYGPAANIAVETGCSVTLDSVKVEASGSVLYPRGDAATVMVKDCEITTTGAYVIATNAATTSNYNVNITVTDSTLSVDGSTILVNVPCTLNIENSTIIGKFHSVIARGGDVTIKNSTLDNQIAESSWNSYKEYFGTSAWGSGNNVRLAALTVGNNHTTSYQYKTQCTLEGVKFIVGDGQRTVSIHGNANADIGAYLTYDSASEVGTVEYLGGYVSINDEVQTAQTTG